MKRTISLLALAIVAGVSFSAAFAAKKDKKTVAPVAPVKEVVTLQSKADSLCYAAGQAHTMGMMEYVKSQLGVDSAYVQVFVDALREALNTPDTPEAKAKAAATQIASMVGNQMEGRLKGQLDEMKVAYDGKMFKRGFMDAVEKDASVMSVEESQKYFSGEMQAMQTAAEEAKKAAGIKWLEQNKAKEGVKVTASGLQYKVIREGNGNVATENADVEVKYEGKLIDGTVFDSSYKRNPQTTTFKPSQVIKGWTEALCMMPEGSEWELYIPYELAYGARGTGNIPAYSTLIFKVEVVKVTPEKAAEPAPQPKPATKPISMKKPAARKK